MTTPQKALVAVTLAVLATAGIHEARQVARLREENQLLRDQQVPLVEQIRQLQQQRDQATSRVAGLLAENARSQSNPQQTELLKLRGQVGVLQQELLSAAKTNSLANALADFVSDPGQKEVARIQTRQALQARYASFIQSQKLAPAAADKFIALITQSELNKKDRLAALVRGEVDVATALQDRDNSKQELAQQLQALLGEAGYAQYVENNVGVGAFFLMKGINDQLGHLALNEQQSQSFLALLGAAPEAFVTEDEVDLFRTKEALDAIYQKRFDRGQQLMQDAAAFLSPEQAAALGTLNTQYWNGVRTQWTLGQQWIQRTLRR